MKSYLYVLFLIVLCGCSHTTEELYGTWKVQSKYYRATYEIYMEHDSVKAKVLYYNDDTSIYRDGDTKEYYLFKNLKPDGKGYADAISGATITNNNKTIYIEPKHRDTLTVTHYIMHKPLNEIWVRNEP